MNTSRPQTILFADVSGSTRLFETKGDQEARRLIAAVLDALTKICQQHGGRVIKTIGDEIMCTFPGALNGVLAACDMQRKMGREIEFVRDSLAVRIGLHHGDALEEADGDVYGDAVNTAARMASLAKREQVVTTAATYDSLSGKVPEARSLGKARVSGKLLPIEIVDLVWQEDTSGMTMVQSAIRGPAAAEEKATLRLRHRAQQVTLDTESKPFSMGREPSNQLTIEADWVSRTHAMIEYKRGHFMIADRSTNGTYVRIGDDDEIKVHRDELHLRKAGTISLGQSFDVNTGDIIYFEAD
ncbi:adenylate/guanylate cyclase domain-containing protein [Arenimonas terrae]|jgi:adenylate cyclase|uniref:Adenylate/guanylate cyclase domain-containing protein n=1 Tax=Arenimonas terrae TaxID=2546226 RepID=A0A5C4RUQ3_9GAMM|nr:adenylate/guanylate cyclase domain-containing protein [Arenimonas terrae]TNJ34714.1 adenylate/guanylate cyclase domain-containing protein [Arenimonas terrae]